MAIKKISACVTAVLCFSAITFGTQRPDDDYTCNFYNPEKAQQEKERAKKDLQNKINSLLNNSLPLLGEATFSGSSLDTNGSFKSLSLDFKKDLSSSQDLTDVFLPDFLEKLNFHTTQGGSFSFLLGEIFVKIGLSESRYNISVEYTGQEELKAESKHIQSLGIVFAAFNRCTVSLQLDQPREVSLDISSTQFASSELFDLLAPFIGTTMNITKLAIGNGILSAATLEFLQEKKGIHTLKVRSNYAADPNDISKNLEKIIGLLPQSKIATLRLQSPNNVYQFLLATTPSALYDNFINAIGRCYLTKVDFFGCDKDFIEHAFSDEKQDQWDAALSAPIEQREVPISSDAKSAAKSQKTLAG